MNQLSKEVKTRIIIFHDKSHKAIADDDYKDLINAKEDTVELSDGSIVKFSAIAKILTNEEYVREYPKEYEETKKERYYGEFAKRNKDKVFWDEHKTPEWLNLSPQDKSKTKGEFIKFLFNLFGRTEVLKLKRIEMFSKIIEFYKNNPLRYYPDFEIFEKDLLPEKMNAVEDRALVAILKTIETDIIDAENRRKYGRTDKDMWPEDSYKTNYGDVKYSDKYNEYR